VYGKVIAGYTAYILAKIEFHHLHAEIDPCILLQKFMETSAKSFLQDPSKAYASQGEKNPPTFQFPISPPLGGVFSVLL